MTKFLLGLGLGVMIGSLIAPASGEETRRQLVEKAEDFRDERLGKMMEMGRQKAGEYGREAGEKAFEQATRKVAGDETVDRAEQRRA
jgi:gas vesicle protein